MPLIVKCFWVSTDRFAKNDITILARTQVRSQSVKFSADLTILYMHAKHVVQNDT